jgi:electron-transferring-flavoprotein dehydrogenase
VIDPIGIDKLLPDWRDDKESPIQQPVLDDRFYWLSEKRAFRIPAWPMPPLMSNHGNFIVSLGLVCRWLGKQAEALGVEIYPASRPPRCCKATRARSSASPPATWASARAARRRTRSRAASSSRAVHVVRRRRARQPLEDAHPALRPARPTPSHRSSDRLKELWQVQPGAASARPGPAHVRLAARQRHRRRLVLYHFGENLVSVGFVVHLNYRNPWLSPFEELQRFKTHKLVRDTFEGGKRLVYGARAITDGGWQSVPRLVFPGGALVGCAAGFMNVPRIKGSHNAILSAILAAEEAAAALKGGRAHDELAGYESGWRTSPIGKDLKKVRNVKPLWSKLGTVVGAGLGGIDMWTNTLGFSVFGTLRHSHLDSETLVPASEAKKIDYPKPDGKLTFDRLSSVFLSNTNHEGDQPIHLRVANPALQLSSEHDIYGGPSARYCPPASTNGRPRAARTCS